MRLKLPAVVAIALGVSSCSQPIENVDNFKSKVIGHWYCAPNSEYEEVIFTDSAFMAHGTVYGTMFRSVKYVYPDSLHYYDEGILINRVRVTFKDSTMTATSNQSQIDYHLISRLDERKHDYELLFDGNKSALNISDLEWRIRWLAWTSGEKFYRWQVKESQHTTSEKMDLLGQVDDSFVKAMLVADTSYQKNTLPLFHFFDADHDGNEEIGFWGIAGAADEFFKAYKSEGSQYKPWIYEIGRLVHCASFRDTTWIVIYSPVMVGDEGAVDSVITYTIARSFKDRKAK
jgi:hypothetical protein